MHDWQALVRATRHAGPADADAVAELADFAEHRYTELRGRGVSDEEAVAAALAEVGAVNVSVLRRRRMRTSAAAAIGGGPARPLQGLWGDVRLALRVLRMNPGFAAGALLTLFVGLGGAITIFAIINGVLLRPLPYPRPNELVRLGTVAGGELRRTSALDFLDWRRESTSYAELGMTIATNVVVTDDAGSQRMAGEVVEEKMLELLGARPQLGRLFRPEDTQAGAAPVAVLSHAGWRGRFGGDPDIVGRHVRVDGVDTEIVGVLAPGFRFLDRQPEIFASLTYSGSIVREDNRGLRQWEVYGRLRPGVTVAAGDRDIRRVAAAVAARWPDSNAGLTARAVPLREHLVGDARGSLLLLFAAVGFMGLIAATNLLNLLLTRALRREREVGVRLALGASRGRVVRQFLAEAGVLSILGSVLGLALAATTLRVLPVVAAGRLPRLHDLAIDGRVVAFAAAAAILTTLLIGLLPAVRSSGARGLRAVRGATRGTGGLRGSERMGRALMTAEVACAVLLVATAGLLVRSLLQLQRLDPGFDVGDDVTLFDVSTAQPSFPARGLFYQRLLDALRSNAGVDGAGAAYQVPLSGANMITTLLEPIGQGLADAERPRVGVRIITPGLLDAMRIPLVRGRDFSDADRDGAARVVLVNEEAARRYWPTGEPLGAQLEIDLGMGGQLWGGTVVGVVADVHSVSVTEPVGPEVYLPQAQAPVEDMTVVVRSALDPQAIAALARSELATIDPTVPVSGVTTLHALADAARATPRFYSLLIGIFAAISLLLAAIGVYGVVSFGVQQRTQEFGIRIALGARPRSLLAGVLGRTLVHVLAGVLIGVAAFLASSRLLASVTRDIRVADPVYLATVSVLLLAVGTCASLLPALRATRVDPVSVINTG